MWSWEGAVDIKKMNRLSSDFLFNLALKGLLQPLCCLPKAHTEWLFWDKATPSVILEMFGEKLHKIS